MGTAGSAAGEARFPDIADPRVGLVLIGEWRVRSAAGQRAAMEAVRQAWAAVGWPEGLLSHTTLAGSDQTTLVQYAQWRSEDHAREFSSGSKQQWVDEAHHVAAVARRKHPMEDGIVNARPGVQVLGYQRFTWW